MASVTTQDAREAPRRSPNPHHGSAEAQLKEAQVSVAGIILSQLGGNKFCVMTGAKNFVSGENSLSFALPKMSGVKVNRVRVVLVRVVLAIDDTYTVSFFNIRGVKAEPVSTHAGVYCEDLRGVFERETGLRTLVGSRVYRTPWKRDER